MLKHIVEKTISQHRLFQSHHRLLVAVSGGKDSMALLHVLHSLGYCLEVAHMNFQLRGEASDLDEALVKDCCEKWNLSLHIKRVNTKAYAQEKQLSTQLAARALRYDWFKELLQERRLDYLITAHHAQDNIETLLLHFTKGIGPKGLKGIPIQNEQMARPMLKATPTQILDYLQQENIVWREDASNQTNAYYRNRIRHEVIPQLELINPGLYDTFALNLQRFQEMHGLFVQAYADFQQACETTDTGWKIPISYVEQTPAIALCLEEALKPHGFSSQDLRQIPLIREDGKRIIGKATQLLRSRGYWIWAPLTPEAFSSLTIPAPGQYEKIALEYWEGEPQFQNPNEIYLDADKVLFPLTLRRLEEQDRFIPYGMNQYKLVKKFLKNDKIDPITRANQLVLSSSEHILWVVGQRVDHRVAINDKTRKILRISLV